MSVSNGRPRKPQHTSSSDAELDMFSKVMDLINQFDRKDAAALKKPASFISVPEEYAWDTPVEPYVYPADEVEIIPFGSGRTRSSYRQEELPEDEVPLHTYGAGAFELDTFERPEAEQVHMGPVYAEELIQRGSDFVVRYQQQKEADRRITQMREIAGKFGWHSYYYGGGRLFYEQALLMEDFTCNKPYHGSFYKPYPTYEDMTDKELKGYFTWRTSWRNGQELEAPHSFLLTHAFELLCGVGADGHEDVLVKLAALRDAYADKDGHKGFDMRMNCWMRDYVMHWNLDPKLAPPLSVTNPLRAAQNVLGCAEHLILQQLAAQDSGEDRGKPIQASSEDFEIIERIPTKEEIFDALCVLGRNGIKRSKLIRSNKKELVDITVAVFSKMVEHCAKRRNTNYMEGMFGSHKAERYFPFEAAVFYDPEAPVDTREYAFTPQDRYTFEAGMWFEQHPFRREATNAKLGDLLHTVDRLLREELGIQPALAPRKLPAYQLKMVQEVLGAYFADKRAREAAQITIDRTRLGRIRTAASTTREALLVDEERDGLPASEPPLLGEKEAVPVTSTRETMPVEEPAGSAEVLPSNKNSADVHVSTEVREASAASQRGDNPYGLSAQQLELIGSLLEGKLDQKKLASQGIVLSLEIDAINEALFDLVGDTVIEFIGDEPELVADYIEDVQGVLKR